MPSSLDPTSSLLRSLFLTRKAVLSFLFIVLFPAVDAPCFRLRFRSFRLLRNKTQRSHHFLFGLRNLVHVLAVISCQAFRRAPAIGRVIVSCLCRSMDSSSCRVFHLHARDIGQYLALSLWQGSAYIIACIYSLLQQPATAYPQDTTLSRGQCSRVQPTSTLRNMPS